MPSTNKTPNYELNQWLGTDNPKRTDYNSDNLIMDTELKNNADNISNLTNDTKYQAPTIIGTQIQIVRNSNDIDVPLKFKLDSDLASGAITISTDGGLTEKPLQDIEGNNITQLDKGFVEVVEDTTFFTYAPKGFKLDEIIGAIEAKGGTVEEPQKPQDIVNSINNDLFGTGDIMPTERLSQLNLTTLTDNSDYVSTVFTMCPNQNSFLLANGTLIRELNYEPTTLIWSVSISYTPYDSVLYNGKYYIPTTEYIYNYAVGTGVSASNRLFTNGTIIKTLCFDTDGNMYIGTDSGIIRKYNTSMVQQWTYTHPTITNINKIYFHDGFLYIAGTGTNKMAKVTISGSEVWSKPLTAGNVNTIIFLDNYLIPVLEGNTRLYKYDLDGNSISNLLVESSGNNVTVQGACVMYNGDIFVSGNYTAGGRTYYYKIKRDISSVIFLHFISVNGITIAEPFTIPQTPYWVFGYGGTSTRKYRLGYVIN